MTRHDNRLTRRDSPFPVILPAGGNRHLEVRGMLAALEGLGYDLDRLLAAAGLRRRDVEDPEAYLSPAACATVFSRAEQERRVPNLPLQLALHTPIGSNPPLDYLIASSDSVGQGLERLARYLRLVNPGVRMTVEDDENPVRVLVEAGSPFEVELARALSVLRFRKEADGFAPVYASFDREPDDVLEFARVQGCPIRTRASWNGWALAKDLMGRPLRRRDPALRRWLDRQAAEILARLPRTGDVADEVRRVLSSLLTAGEGRIDVVARRLATTPRTLQRRLARTGTSFEAIRDDARKEAAEAYLAEGALSVGEIAYLLGYSEPSAFHRAFKRWHGATPHAFRARPSAGQSTRGRPRGRR